METGLHEDGIDDIIEKPLFSGKTPEELLSHMIDENLSDLKKALLMLESNNESRCMVAIKMIPELLKNDKINCLDLLFPKFKQICFTNNHTLELYEILSNTLIQILQSSLLLPKEFCYQFNDLVISKIINNNLDTDDTICLVWIEILLKLIDNLPQNYVTNSIFEPILNKKLPSNHRKREYFCMILGKCASKVDGIQLEKQLFPIIIDLCNDTRYEVRAAACHELPNVLKALGPKLAFQIGLPELVKFISDESLLVKATCLQALSNSLSYFDDDVRKNVLIKIQLLIDFGMNLKDELFTITISKIFETVIKNSHYIMTNESKLYFINIFNRLCKDQSIYNRRSLAETKYIWSKCKLSLTKCLPHIVHLTDVQTYRIKIGPCLNSFINDKDEEVRKATIECFVDIAQNSQTQNYQLILNEFSNVMSDESLEVIDVLSGKISQFFEIFVKKSSNGISAENQVANFDFVLERLLHLEEKISQTYKYTIHVNVLESFKLLPWLVRTDELVDKVLPILESRLNARALPVRLVATRCLLIILRKIPRVHIRNECYLKLLEFSTNRNCYKRIMFVEICLIVYELYSKSFFKNWFYEHLINLANDNITNVKLAFIKILVKIKKLWTIYDREKLNVLEKIIENLLHDKDRDVVSFTEKIIVQLDLIKPYSNSNDPEEKFDKIKENEELLLVELETKKIRGGSRCNIPFSVTNQGTKSQTNNETIKKRTAKSSSTLKNSSFSSPLLSANQLTTKDNKQRENNDENSYRMQKPKNTLIKRGTITFERDDALSLTRPSTQNSNIIRKYSKNKPL